MELRLFQRIEFAEDPEILPQIGVMGHRGIQDLQAFRQQTGISDIKTAEVSAGSVGHQILSLGDAVSKGHIFLDAVLIGTAAVRQ